VTEWRNMNNDRNSRRKIDKQGKRRNEDIYGAL
jgi:hypothetical protein